MEYRNTNINAYKQVENAENYKTTKELEEYRSKRLNDVLPATEFIEKNIYKGVPLRVLEYCSGSSCLLYSLEKRGLLKEGFGVEISENRFGFAERWKNDHGFTKVKNLNLNAEELDFPEDSFDLIILVDSAFCYFFPENFGGRSRRWRRFRRDTPGGGQQAAQTAWPSPPAAAGAAQSESTREGPVSHARLESGVPGGGGRPAARARPPLAAGLLQVQPERGHGSHGGGRLCRPVHRPRRAEPPGLVRPGAAGHAGPIAGGPAATTRGCVKTGGEGRARGAEIWGNARSPGWNASRGTPDAVHSALPPPRRAALAPAVHPPDNTPVQGHT